MSKSYNYISATVDAYNRDYSDPEVYHPNIKRVLRKLVRQSVLSVGAVSPSVKSIKELADRIAKELVP